MALSDLINKDIKAAMLAKDKDKLEALRAIKAAILMANTSGEEVNEGTEIAILKRLVKQRRESAAIYKEKNREDLAEAELKQLAYIEVYLPEQMSDDQIKEEVLKIINDLNASGMQDMGKVMGAATKKMSGKADNKIISQIVRNVLSS